MKHRTPTPWIAVLLWLPALLWAPAVFSAPSDVQDLPTIEPVPRPDLSTVPPEARRRMEAIQSNLEVVSISGQVSGRELAEGYGVLGQFFHAFGFLAEAETCYTNSRRLVPADFRWAYQRGRLRQERSALGGAAEDLESAVAMATKDLAARVRLGEVYLAQNRGADARALFSQLLRDLPDHPAALYGLGRSAALLGAEDAALRHLEKALIKQPAATTIHRQLAALYERRGDAEKAAYHASKQGDVAVGFPDPLASMVEQLAIQPDLQAILTMLDDPNVDEEALLERAFEELGSPALGAGLIADHLKSNEGQLEPVQEALLHYLQGALLVSSGGDTNAIPALERALELKPDLGDARIKLGNAYVRAERHPDALGQYNRLLRQQPENVDGILRRAATLTLMGRGEEALPDLRNLVKLAPDNAEAHVRLATALLQKGDQDGALERFHTAAALDNLNDRQRAEIYARLGALYGERGVYDKAVENYAASLDSDPRFIPAYADLGALLASLGRMREAAEVYRSWVQVDPSAQRARLAGASALIMANQHTEAKDFLESSLRIFPENTRLQSILARHLAACPDRAVRDGIRALELALEAYSRSPTLEIQETLAMAYAQAGRYQEAIEQQKRLLEELADEPAAVRLRSNLALYEAGQPCCAPAG